MANVVHIYCRTLASAPCSRGYYHIADVGWVTVDGTPGSFHAKADQVDCAA